jgi:ABC-type transport system substrate-binding protein
MSASQAGSRFVWKRNTNFYRQGLPYIDEVRYLIIAEPGTAHAAFQTRQTDALLGGLGPRDIGQVVQKSPDAVVFEGFKSVASWRWYVNTRKAPLDDARVRRALSLALDREKFLNTLGDGKFKIALEGVQHGLLSDDEIKQYSRYDPQEAKRLLAEAGYPNGIDLDTTFPGKAYGEVYITGLELAQSQLKGSGIRLNLISEDKGDWNAKRRKGDYFLGLQQNSSVEADMDSWLFGALYSKSGYNYNGVNDPKMDELIFAQRREGNPEKRRELLRNVVKYMIDKGYSIGIGNIPQYEVIQPYLKNYAPLEWVKGTIFTEAWLDK